MEIVERFISEMKITDEDELKFVRSMPVPPELMKDPEVIKDFIRYAREAYARLEHRPFIVYI